MSDKPRGETQEAERMSSRVSLEKAHATPDTVRMRVLPDEETDTVAVRRREKAHTMESRMPESTLDEVALSLLMPPEGEDPGSHTLSDMAGLQATKATSVRDSATLQEYSAGVGGRDSLTSIGRRKPLVPPGPLLSPPPASLQTVTEDQVSGATFYEGSNPETMGTFYDGDATASDLTTPASLFSHETPVFEDTGEAVVSSQEDAFATTVEASVSEQKQPVLESGGTQDPRRTILPRIQTSEGRTELISEGKERYETLHPLGSGSMGDVMLVADNDIQRYVAMKRLKEPEKQAQVARFIKEVQVVGQLEHPNIVPIHDVGKDNEGHYYFVMKYVEGDTMGQLIRKMKQGDREVLERFPFEKRVDIFLQLLYAIQFAHGQDILHRDIKPDNVMIGDYGQVMVMDWGISTRLEKDASDPAPQRSKARKNKLDTASRQALDSLGDKLKESSASASITRHNILLGTPAYMSPEQVLGEKADKHSDLYSLSALLYEWITLRHYLEHRLSNVHELLFAITNEAPAFAVLVKSPHQEAVPPELAHFLHKGLNKDPSNRFQSIEEMIYRIEEIQQGIAPVQCPITFTRRTLNAFRRFVSRRPMLGVMGFAITSLFVVMGIWKVVEVALQLVS